MVAKRQVDEGGTGSREGCTALRTSKVLTFSQRGDNQQGPANMCILTAWLHGNHLKLYENRFCLK